MSIDFGKFKKKREPKQEFEREIVRNDTADMESDKLEKSDKEKMSDKSAVPSERKSDKSDIPPKYDITSDHLRAIHVLLTGKTNRGYSKRMLKQKIVEVLTNGIN